MGELTGLLEKLMELNTQIVTTKFDGREYCREQLLRVPLSNEMSPETKKFSTLTGLAEFASKFTPPVESDEGCLFFHVENHETVSLVGGLQPKNFNKRFRYAVATLELDAFHFATQQRPSWHDLELFVIGLQSLFVQNETVNDIINMLGRVSDEHVTTNSDDGFSQSLQIRTGIVTRETVKVTNPCMLKPWRTFREVDQPFGSFILRLRKEGGKDSQILKCSLWEADGGIWRQEAMANIKAWLEANTELKAIA